MIVLKQIIPNNIRTSRRRCLDANSASKHGARATITRLLGLIALIVTFGLSACENDNIPADSYYTFTGETVGQFLTNRPEQYSEYVKILERAVLQTDGSGSKVMALLDSYGYYTSFAPANDAIQKYLEKYGLTEVEQMTDSAVRVIASMSVIASDKGNIYEAKNFTAKIADQNLYKKTIYIDPVVGESSYMVNSMAKIVERDLKAHNGVVHRVDSVLEPSDLTLLGFFDNYPEYSLFAEAVRLTAIYERVNSELEDLNYVPPVSMQNNSGNDMQDFPKRRFFYYTCFVTPNAVFAEAGINDIDSLKGYAKQWFKNTYELQAPAIYAAGNNEQYTNENNYMNRFVAYHFVDKKIDKADFTLPRNTYQRGYDKVLDYTETLAPGQTLCYASGLNTFESDDFEDRLQLNPSAAQVPLPNEERYRGWTRSARNGVLLSTKGMLESANGCFHELEGILTYPREDFRRQRMRLDYTALSPEFMSNAIRYIVRKGGGYGLPMGYLTNFWFNSSDTKILYLAPDGSNIQSPSNTGGTWNDFHGDELIVKGSFDFTVKLPPVPAGQYEIRIGYTVNGRRGCAQVYLGSSRDNMIAQGIPMDLTVPGTRLGWVADTRTDDDFESDKLLHANGAMKGPNSSNNSGGGGTLALRNQGDSGGEYAIRRVVGVINMEEDGNIYVRYRNATTSTTPEFMMDYIEICPSSIYDNPEAIEPRD